MSESYQMSPLIQKLRYNRKIDESDITQHIYEFHKKYAGFTEKIISYFKTSEGKDSYNLLADSSGDISSSKVIDLACGSGLLSEILAQKVTPKGCVYAVDFSEEELNLARNRCNSTKIKFITASAQNLPFKSSSIDAVFCHLGLMVMRPLNPVIKEISRVLKPNGIFSAVIQDTEHKNILYNQFCSLVDDELSKEFPGLTSISFSDKRLNSIDSSRNLLELFFSNNSIISFKNFIVYFSGSSEDVLNSLILFFYTTYLLSENGINNLKLNVVKNMDIFSKEDIIFPVPHTLVRLCCMNNP